MSPQPVEVVEGLVPITYSCFGLYGRTWPRMPELKPPLPIIQAAEGVAIFTAGRSEQRDHVRVEVYDEAAPMEAEGFEEYAEVIMTCPDGPMRVLWDFNTPIEDMPPVAIPPLIHLQTWVLGRKTLRTIKEIPPDGTSRWLIRISPSDVEPVGEDWYGQERPI